MKKLLNKKGFTLIELIVVIAILAILALILIPSLLNYINEANAAKNKSNARGFYSEVALVYATATNETDFTAKLAAVETRITAAECTLNGDTTLAAGINGVTVNCGGEIAPEGPVTTTP